MLFLEQSTFMSFFANYAVDDLTAQKGDFIKNFKMLKFKFPVLFYSTQMNIGILQTRSTIKFCIFGSDVRMLYIFTSVWVLPTENTCGPILFRIFAHFCPYSQTLVDT